MQGSISPLALSQKLSAILAGAHGGRGALATVIGRSGSAPQAVGAKMLLCADGTQWGTVGGGAIEAQVEEACRKALRFGRSERVRADLVRDLAMCCGGSMEVFVEYIEARQRLFVLGAGHVSQALAPLLVGLNYELWVLDDRDELLRHPAFADIETGSYDADEVAEAVPMPTDRDAYLVMTRDHARDEKAVAQILEQPHAFVGMIGSRRKVHTVLRRMLRRYDERGRARPDLSRLRSPLGLTLGGRTPAEIAVSIAAELVALRHGGDGAPMSIVDEVLTSLDAGNDKQSA